MYVYRIEPPGKVLSGILLVHIIITGALLLEFKSLSMGKSYLVTRLGNQRKAFVCPAVSV